MNPIQNFTISIAGAGNLGSYLAVEFFNAGCVISQIFNRTLQTADSLAKKVDAEAIDSIESFNADVDFLIIALPDRIIPEFLSELGRQKIFKDSKTIFLSTAGAVHIKDLGNSGVTNFGVLYPLQSFTKKTRPSVEIIPFCIEGGNNQTIEKSRKLASLISRDVRMVDSDQRILLHLAAVFACNFTNHMIALADEIIARVDTNRNILDPLVNETIQRLKSFTPEEMQTGPAVRNDSVTIEKHKKLLEDLGYHNLTALYSAISESISTLRFKNNK